MYRKDTLILTTLMLLFGMACKTPSATVTMETKQQPKSENEIYRASATRQFDLIHTKLEVSFDWEKRQMPGLAELSLKPHFYPTNLLYLNARGMQINSVQRIVGESRINLNYVYRNDSICISLDQTYRNTDTIKVFIDYIAKPEDLPKGGSQAISSDKGLYFINADGKIPDKPRQVWTQGETQASSVWFPTIDWPNQKTTQEIYITVDTVFETLSNGVKVSSQLNARNGTRTDYWKQDLPHAPYLFMMAVGDYAIVKDSWRGKEVSYYVEHDYEQYARNIFGTTPEMLEFFSKKLGVDYPWGKYAQVVVRDYVSGAMENTTATIFGEFMQQDPRSQLDNRMEDVVSHELFHHWFGDLVTCESWANIPLNESFATYGEYLWNEYKYGKDFADHLSNEDLRAYLKEAKNKQVDLIRFHYHKQEDVFDRHSYQKGGRILHMLRCYVGDDAFFEGLKRYLNNYRFGTVEAHGLRMVFEEVTGEDLNWFFNQWFFSKGHTDLKITHEWNIPDSTYRIRVEQKQDLNTVPLYTLPVDVDIYEASGVSRKRIWVQTKDTTLNFKLKTKPYLVNFDARKMLLGVKDETKPSTDWVYQYHHAPLYLDRYEGLARMGAVSDADGPQADALRKALNDPSPRIREIAVNRCDELVKYDAAGIKKQLIAIGGTDLDPGVRSSALDMLTTLFPSDPDVKTAMIHAIDDSSYNVMAQGCEFLMRVDPVSGGKRMRELEHTGNSNITDIVSGIYALHGADDQYEYMSANLKLVQGEDRYYAYQEFGKFLERCSQSKALSGIEQLAEYSKSDPDWTNRLAATLGIENVNKNYGKQSESGTEANGPGEKAEKERREVESAKVRNKAQDLLLNIYASESDPNLMKIYALRK